MRLSTITSPRARSAVLAAAMAMALTAARAAAPAGILATPVTVTLNPNGNAPLSAVAVFTTKNDALVQVDVQGEIPVTHLESAPGKTHAVPILGLYPGRTNMVVLTIRAPRLKPEVQTLSITTGPLPAFFPAVSVIASNAPLMEPGMNLCAFQYSSGGVLRSFPFMVDAGGAVRWYLDLSAYNGPCLPFRRLADGNFVFAAAQEIHEIDSLGHETSALGIPGYTLHDEIIELPNGNLACAADKPGTTIINGTGLIPSRGDIMIEVDRTSGAIRTELDMRAILQVDRNQQLNNDGDWFHMNGIVYSAADDTFILSGRHQGVVKVGRDNSLKWILDAHHNWTYSGPNNSGPKPTNYLLTAVDAAGAPYPGEPFQDDGAALSPFDWPWSQRTPLLLPNGNVLVFDSGFERNYILGPPFYSRAVEYAVDESVHTVFQVWEYGMERGTDLYSPFAGNVQDLAMTGNRLFTAGMNQGTAGPQARIVEVAYPGNAVVFEAAVLFRNLASTGTAYGQYDLADFMTRLPLYPPEPLLRPRI